MKQRILAVLVGLAVLGVPPARAELRKTYDRFTQKTVVVIPHELKKETPQPLLLLRGEFAGQNPSGPPLSIKLGLTTLTRELQYGACHDINWLADGEPVQVGETKYNGAMTPERKAWELIQIENVPFEVVRRLAAASKVEVRLCRTELTLTAEELQDLRDFVALAGPTAVPSEVPAAAPPGAAQGQPPPAEAPAPPPPGA